MHFSLDKYGYAAHETTLYASRARVFSVCRKKQSFLKKSVDLALFWKPSSSLVKVKLGIPLSLIAMHTNILLMYYYRPIVAVNQHPKTFRSQSFKGKTHTQTRIK